MILLLVASLQIVACGSRWGIVQGQSMAPTLKDGQRVLIQEAPDALKKGDIVTFHPPRLQDRSFVQRIVGVPGERVEITAGQTIVVPADQYYIMGDNRQNSFDSRAFGPVPKSAIWGRIIWPSPINTRQP